ncbi:MAG: peptidoglycan-binding protein [Verrucomicrobiota bacterium]|nr:peptidoglycan-binding protein [Verrucomicrobiota bacterium]
MSHLPLFRSITMITLGLAMAAPVPAAKASPLEHLHKRLFGDDDDHKKKKKKKDKDHDYHGGHHQCIDVDHGGDCDRCGKALVVIRRSPVIEVRPSYERRYESYEEPASRRYAPVRSLEIDVQMALRRAGYYRGPIDGAIGPGSRNAIREFQVDNGLAVTGRIDRGLCVPSVSEPCRRRRLRTCREKKQINTREPRRLTE